MSTSTELDNFSARFIENQLLFNIISIDEKDCVWVSILNGLPNLIKIIDAYSEKSSKNYLSLLNNNYKI